MRSWVAAVPFGVRDVHGWRFASRFAVGLAHPFVVHVRGCHLLATPPDQLACGPVVVEPAHHIRRAPVGIRALRGEKTAPRRSMVASRFPDTGAAEHHGQGRAHGGCFVFPERAQDLVPGLVMCELQRHGLETNHADVRKPSWPGRKHITHRARCVWFVGGQRLPVERLSGNAPTHAVRFCAETRAAPHNARATVLRTLPKKTRRVKPTRAWGRAVKDGKADASRIVKVRPLHEL